MTTPSAEAILASGRQIGQSQIRQLILAVIEFVRYDEFTGAAALEDFDEMRWLAFMDEFSRKGEEEKQAEVKAPLASLRDHPAFERVVERVRAGMEWATTPRNMRDILDDVHMEDARARRLQRIAVHAKDPKMNMKALELLLARQIAPKAKELEAQAVAAQVMLGAEHHRLLVDAMRHVKEVRELPPPDPEVDDAAEDEAG